MSTTRLIKNSTIYRALANREKQSDSSNIDLSSCINLELPLVPSSGHSKKENNNNHEPLPALKTTIYQIQIQLKNKIKRYLNHLNLKEM